MQQTCLVRRRYSADQLVDPTLGQAQHACDPRQDRNADAQRQKPGGQQPVFRLQALKELFGPRHDTVEYLRHGRRCDCLSGPCSLREQETPHQDSVRRTGTAPTEGAIHDPLPVAGVAFDAHQ
jgi:hypothetical protein